MNEIYKVKGKPLAKAKVFSGLKRSKPNLKDIASFKLETRTNVVVVLKDESTMDFKFEYRKTCEEFEELLTRMEERCTK